MHSNEVETNLIPRTILRLFSLIFMPRHQSRIWNCIPGELSFSSQALRKMFHLQDYESPSMKDWWTFTPINVLSWPIHTVTAKHTPYSPLCSPLCSPSIYLWFLLPTRKTREPCSWGTDVQLRIRRLKFDAKRPSLPREMVLRGNANGSSVVLSAVRLKIDQCSWGESPYKRCNQLVR